MAGEGNSLTGVLGPHALRRIPCRPFSKRDVIIGDGILGGDRPFWRNLPPFEAELHFAAFGFRVWSKLGSWSGELGLEALKERHLHQQLLALRNPAGTRAAPSVSGSRAGRFQRRRFRLL
jgi:hypothetical protein